MENLDNVNKKFPEKFKKTVDFFESKNLNTENNLDINSVTEELQKQQEIILETTNQINIIRHNLGLDEKAVGIPSLDNNKEKVKILENQISRFNLQKPEGYGENKKKYTFLQNQEVPEGANFDDLHRGGQKIELESGDEKIIKSISYDVSDGMELKIRGRDFSYKDKNDNKNIISAEYNKDSGVLEKMHFDSENPIFAGKAILDMVERIPPGADVLGNEVSMSGDSFPLLLNTLVKYFNKDNNRFSISQIGEFNLNDQGKYSDISKTDDKIKKVYLLNQKIQKFKENTGIDISNAYVSKTDGGEEIMIPKIKILKNY
jgi:hypothetical protein